MSTVLLVLLLITDFTDTVTCTVQGYVWKLTDNEPVAFTRVDYCEGVRQVADDTSLVLYSPTRWVRIRVPPEPGQRRFMYRWTAGLAHIGTTTIPIEWGRVQKG